jgi:hypothetical protein
MTMIFSLRSISVDLNRQEQSNYEGAGSSGCDSDLVMNCVKGPDLGVHDEHHALAGLQVLNTTGRGWYQHTVYRMIDETLLFVTLSWSPGIASLDGERVGF